MRDKNLLGEEGVSKLGSNITELLLSRLTKKEEKRDSLRMSNFGTKCDRKLWYQINTPDDAEPLLPPVRIKFLYGDIIEELLLSLASEAGHRVEGRQDKLELEGIIGHRDAIIDGMLVDVKSANARSFLKHKKLYKDIKNDIWFSSYIDQLQMYLEASQDDPLLKVKNAGALLAISKEMGNLALQIIPRQNYDWSKKIEEKKRIVNEISPPPRNFEDEKDGMSGNRKLCTYCSYCNFKKKCWPEMRTFLSSTGPKHLTVVKREPNITEIN